MKLNNFRRFDPDYTAAGHVGLTRGNKLEEAVWNDFADAPEKLYIEGEGTFEFERTASRLREMQDASWGADHPAAGTSAST